MERAQNKYLFKEEIHAKKMIFLSGPRQVGKTTFARHFLKEAGDEGLYWNWDDPFVRKEYIKNPRFIEKPVALSKHACPVVVFDEIHKQKNWKNILKGFYDTFKGRAIFFVTGSARLDFFRASGDSLVGRYFSYRMLPLGLPEAAGKLPRTFETHDIFQRNRQKQFLSKLSSLPAGAAMEKPFARLLEFGGFPEPFLKASRSFSLRWRRDYGSLLVREDIRDLTRIQDIRGIEQLLHLLPERVGVPLSINALREDLGVHHKTVSMWLQAYKKVFLVFSLKPWHRSLARSIRKEEKYYFYDWTFIENESYRLENMLAVMLLRMVCRFNELGEGDFSLHYLRTRDGAEVDFLMTRNNKPFALFESKTGEADIPSHATRFARALNVPYYQVLGKEDVLDVFDGDRYVVPAWRLLMLTG